MALIKEILGIDMMTPVYKSKLVEGDSEQLAGVEIETEEVRATAGDYQSMLGRLWNVKTDGSLRGAAFEFVSRPCAIKSLIPELEVFYKKTQFTEANYSDRCSVHVHTNVLDMTPDQLASLCLLYSVMEEVLFKFVNTYEVGNRVPSRDTNLYCVPWSQCRMNYGVVNKLFTLDGLGLRNWQKYTALNLLPVRNIGTVEWRHMHGTANVKKLSIWINMIDSLLTYAKKTELGGLIEIIKDLNNHSLYQQFYEATLGNALPYQQEYADALYQGVINAKYSLIGYSMQKKGMDKRAKPKEVPPVQALFDDIVDRRAVPPDVFEEAHARLERQIARIHRDGAEQRANIFDNANQVNILNRHPVDPAIIPALREAVARQAPLPGRAGGQADLEEWAYRAVNEGDR